jgi:DNA modification methylase
MKTSKKPASSSKAKKSLKDNKGDSSPSAQSDMKRAETRVEIKPAKGRPMLTWVGKKPLRHAIAYPAQLVESFNAEMKNKKSETWADWSKDLPQTGLLFHGDNKDVLAYLLANGFRGKVQTIYIDPPFDSGADYIRRVELRGKSNAIEIEGDDYSLGEQVQYTDIWANDNYLQFLYDRLLLMRELLSEDGSIFIHLDYRKVSFARLILDEIFGAESFRNDIIWNYRKWGRSDNAFLKNHDTILFYAKSSKNTFNRQYMPLSESTQRRFKGKFQVWADEERTRKITTEDDSEGAFMSDVWEIAYIPGASAEKTGYPTQKPREILERIIKSSSNPNDLVLDCFIGSGTTAEVAQKLGRRWIGVDINKGAIQTTTKRLQGVIQEQVDLSPQPPLLKEMGSRTPEPAQLGFAVYRVNDYDLQIQHNEAFNLAVEHLGMTRTKTDTFFDGTLGKKLVKIVPFNHPVTPLDLEEVKRELNHRPEEERDIVVVSLGKEIAVEAWLEEWNKLRKQGNIPNKIEVIELRSDPKYGGFFTHEPAKAKVSFRTLESDGSSSKKREQVSPRRHGDAHALQNQRVEITIDDFISPTILERLKQQNKDNPLFQPQVSDWRSMVDSVMIDSDYDGKVFNIMLADVPERKNDLVDGKYMVEAKNGATVAVKVTDMLGEEVLVAKQV